MPYPIEIAPTPQFLLRMDIDGMLTDGLRLVVVRRSPKRIHYSDEGLAEECLSKYDFQYSMNLLGGAFRVDHHLSLKQTGRGTNTWDGSTFMTQAEMNGCFERSEAFPVYYEVATFHRRTIPYSREVADKEEREKLHRDYMAYGLEALNESWGDVQSPLKLKATLKVCHEPTLMNYWHVTLNAYAHPFDNVAMTAKKGRWRKMFRLSVEDLLKKESVSANDVEVCLIPEKYFLSSGV